MNERLCGLDGFGLGCKDIVVHGASFFMVLIDESLELEARHDLLRVLLSRRWHAELMHGSKLWARAY